jgi:hypothetical protein
MVGKAKLADAVRSHPNEAAEALAAIQRNTEAPLAIAGVEAAARSLGSSTEELLYDLLVRRRLLKAFVQALEARGVDVGRRVSRALKAKVQGATPRWAQGRTAVSEAALKQIALLSSRIRCRVSVNGAPKGSGCLVGPSLILTAWHVVAPGPPNMKDLPLGAIEVRLANGRREPAIPTLVYESRCTQGEYDNQYPSNDTDYQDYHDIALVRLQRPEGIRLGYAQWPNEPVQPTAGSPLFLLHYPDGRDDGISIGRLDELPGLTVRWGHDADTEPGSSGGACFNHEPSLVGVHQGRHASVRRLVPINRFFDKVRACVQQDIAPLIVWALDGEIVIGRDRFFEGVAEASREATRVRGLRIKRQDAATQGQAGLNFSARMLEHVLERSLGSHGLVRISFDAMAPDLLREIARQANLDQATIVGLEPGVGVQVGDTMLAATMKAAAQRLAEALDAAAVRRKQLLWLFFENPSRSLSEPERIALESFLAVAIYRPRLRVVLAGFETVITPADEFPDLVIASEGVPGFFVEVFGPIEKWDIELVLKRANKDLNAKCSDDAIASMAAEVLLDFTPTNHRYNLRDLDAIQLNIAKKIKVLRRLAEKSV